MEFIRGLYENSEVLGIKNGDSVYLNDSFPHLKNCSSMIDLIKVLDDVTLCQVKSDILNHKYKSVDIADIILLSPIARPIHDIICVGVNYQAHMDEVSGKIDIEQAPAAVYFSKRACIMVGPDGEIENDFDLDRNLDYEVELAVIIGKEGKNISAKDAEDYIFGYSIANDISARHLQKAHGQWYKGKSLDTFSVLGPWIVEKADLPFPINLDIKCSVNGELRQNANTSTFIRDIPTLIEELSKGCTLEAGDIIITGTPAGVGMGFSPCKFLRSGDIVECEIEKIGILRNRIK